MAGEKRTPVSDAIDNLYDVINDDKRDHGDLKVAVDEVRAAVEREVIARLAQAVPPLTKADAEVPRITSNDDATPDEVRNVAGALAEAEREELVRLRRACGVGSQEDDFPPHSSGTHHVLDTGLCLECTMTLRRQARSSEREAQIATFAKERIAAAAIKHATGVVFSLPPPARHNHIIKHMSDLGVYRVAEARHEQGFLTSTGRFVGREEACDIAYAANQIIKKTGGANALYSEDVW